MKRIKVALGELKPNPFKKDIQKGRLNQETIAKLEESMRQKGAAWHGGALQGRENGKIEIAYGHHRLQAMINVFGKSHEIVIEVDDFTDGEMIQKLANENSTKGDMPWNEQVDMVVVAHDWLKDNPTDCKIADLPQGVAKRDSLGRINNGRLHEHGSNICIEAFLGERNWSHEKVRRLLVDADLDDEVKSQVTYRDPSHKPQKGVLTIPAASTLTKLEKPAQVVAAQAIKHEKDVALPAPMVKKAIEYATEFAAKEARPEQHKQVQKILPDSSQATVRAVSTAVTTLSAKKAQPEITAVLVKQGMAEPEAKRQATKIVETTTDVLVEQQKKAAKAAIQAAAEQQRRDEELRKAKDVNSAAQRIINDLVTMDMPFDEDDLKQLIGLREHVSNSMVRGLIEAFRRTAKKFDGYADEFEKPVPKKLTQGK